MKLIERADFFASMQLQFDKTGEEGHCIFISGEAGIGKTSLVRQFCKTHQDCRVYTGTCDDLFTPRPLAPLYDIAWQMGNKFPDHINSLDDRADLFSKFFFELGHQDQKVILVFEDVHWADEATIDFIKFFARRITRTSCLFIITFRDNEIDSRLLHSNIFGELTPDSFTRLQLTPFSQSTVELLAREKGYNGQELYKISGGNPFYVTEILASYSHGIPGTIKDSILSVFNRHSPETKHVWEILSVLPAGIETRFLEEMVPGYQKAIGYCLDSCILVITNEMIFFKHELYRRTIEESLPVLKRIELNKKILELFEKGFEDNNQIERIIHHAKEAQDFERVAQYAPIAALQAANSGAHFEAAKLYFSAIEYTHEKQNDTLAKLYGAYAYESYLTNRLSDAIAYADKALQIWQQINQPEQVGDCLRLLSRLWWFEGDRIKADRFGRQAIEVLESQPSSKAKAMAYSNMAHLEMHMEMLDSCYVWGEKAVSVSNDVDDQETIAQALNIMGSALMLNEKTTQQGIDLLQQSLDIAINNGFHEQIARGYVELGTNGVTIKDYPLAKEYLDKGLQYCEERDIDFLRLYISAWRARLLLETGQWDEAYDIAENLLSNTNLAPPTKITSLVVLATIKIRRGQQGAIPLLMEAKSSAYKTREKVRIVPVFMSLLEYEWLTGESYIEPEILSETVHNMVELKRFSKQGRFYFWLMMAGKKSLLFPHIIRDVKGRRTEIYRLLEFWKQTGSPYEYALSLFEGDEDEKRKALPIIQKLGAKATYEKLRSEMRSSGMKKIPRGMRRNTYTNPAQLTEREMDVLQLLKEGMQNKEIASRLYISTKTVDHHISSILFKLDVNSRVKAVKEAVKLAL